MDAEGLAEIFLSGPARTPGLGVFREMRELKPGHWLIYNRQGMKTGRYWSLESKCGSGTFWKMFPLLCAR